MKELKLNDNWKLHEAPLEFGVNSLSKVIGFTEGWIACSLPCDVRMPLIREGKIRDPVKADYCFESEWIEERSWWFVRTFSSEELDTSSDIVELEIECIDGRGDVFLNGTHLGTHISAHYPFIRDIKEYLVPGSNTLVVCVTTGLETVSDADLAQLNHACCHEKSNGCPERGDKRRAFVRKPQYTVGWDWNPRVVSCGITKNAYIRCFSGAVVRGVNVVTKEIYPAAKLELEIEVEYLHLYKTADADLTVCISIDGRECARKDLNGLLLVSGINYFAASITLENPKLWWPNGYGEQPLYEVSVEVHCDGHTHTYRPFFYGIRTISLDTSQIDENNRRFALVVNGVPVFCKGANYIPSDSIYARVDERRHGKLLSEAKEANFNMLRVWGGGIYETDDFYTLCDRLGILIWHDFMFACSTYPDHLDWFCSEVENELNYQTKRLRNHACLALWCGNNENHWIFNPEDNPGWNIEMRHDKQYGLYLSNYTAKTLVRRNCPQIPYWNSSPYGGNRPNSESVGDTHHWHGFMMNREIKRRIEPFGYDETFPKFVSEYGYPGPPPKASILEYMDTRSPERGNPVWQLHNNIFEKHTVLAGIEKHYGKREEDLNLEDYLLYAGMVQMIMLSYSLEAFRFQNNCSGSLFWMYNDAWGEVGWSIIDYYLRRKISFYGVKRAFEPIKLILRRKNEQVIVFGCNDTEKEVSFDADLGIVLLDGSAQNASSVRITLPSRFRGEILCAPLPIFDDRKAVYALIPQECAVRPAILRTRDIRELEIGGAKLTVMAVEKEDGFHLTVQSDKYAHGVYFDGECEPDDNYFDLLPNEKRELLVKNCARVPGLKKVR